MNAESLTPREQEVLAFIRQGLTNEQIAERLGISADGVKYHVSEITSKLGVTSRYEAVDAASQAAPWWQRALASPLLRIAGAGIVVSAVASVGILTWKVVETESETSSLTELTTNELYERITESATRDGMFVYSTAVTQDLNGGPPTESEIWISTEHGAIYTLSDGFGVLLTENSHWSHQPVDSVELPSPDCDTPSVWLGVFLACLEGTTASVRTELFEGRQVFRLEYSRSYASPGEPDYDETSVVHIDPESFLPLQSVFSWELDGEVGERKTSTYVHEFVPETPELVALLDPEN